MTIRYQTAATTGTAITGIAFDRIPPLARSRAGIFWEIKMDNDIVNKLARIAAEFAVLVRVQADVAGMVADNYHAQAQGNAGYDIEAFNIHAEMAMAAEASLRQIAREC